eukprot:TRINITY_DN37120_c0_g1_i1.p1 TRINITY_DN37120_c0_g1~~TRINITY_DN37120_c0_g1_i1.p1  ORF type:complete len:635 (+),score=110.32 TRINITY_DN37120_c0_g1_i1:59-1963(+)
MQSTELLPVVVAATQELPKATKRTRDGEALKRILQGLLWCSLEVLKQIAQLLPWLICLIAILTIGPSFRSLDLRGVFEQQALVGASLGAALLLLATCLAALLGGRDDSRPVLALFALLVWHMGFQVPGWSEEKRWCLAVLEASGSGSKSQLDHQAAVGLVLLDDMIRAVLRYLAREPSEAWPFALAGHKMYDLWISDEEWWKACYHGTSWQRLPAQPRLQGHASRPLPSPQRLFREAMLLASMMAETAGMMVLLHPGGASSSWAAAPCIASTLLVVSCSPWLPRQSDIVLMEMSRLLSLVSRFSVYFQAVLFLLLGFCSQPRGPLQCVLPEASSLGVITLQSVESAALVVLYVVVACRLLAVTSRCRAASPLYAVQAEDVVPEPPPRRSSRPLYCGSMGRVEGSYAPTQLCDWEELRSRSSLVVDTRGCYVLRRCGELLVAREAHLLSHLDALNLHIEEAEKESKNSPRGALEHQLSQLPGLVVTVLCLAAGATCSWGPSCRSVASALGTNNRFGGLEALLWTLLLLRLGHSWLQALLRNVRACQAAGRAEVFEALDLRRQSCTLHRNLAETQQMIARLEDRIQSLGIALGRRHKDKGNCQPQWNFAQGPASVAILLGWFGCLSILVVLWPHRW